MKKNNYKTCLVFGIIILLIGASVVPSISSETNNKSTSVVIKSDRLSNRLSLQSQNVEPAQSQSPVLDDHIAYNYSGDQVHPTFGRTDTGVLMAAYYDVDDDTIYWGNSSDDGLTFGNETYWDIGGDYPSIKHWEGTQFFGTFVTDPDDLSGGATYLFNCNNPANNGTYNLSLWDWNTDYDWYGMTDADIACDNSQNDWEWGVSSYVISTNYSGYEYTNGPTIVYADPSDEESAYIEWYDYNGCEHTDVDIDPVTHQMYAVYDWYNDTSGKWELLVWEKDFVEVTDEGEIFQFDGLGDLKYPTVAAYDDHIVVLAETDENENKDIVCYYSDSGVNNLKPVFVANTGDDERYPDARHVQDESFICTFIKDNNLYGSVSADGGEQWIATWQINENDGDVIEEYRCSDLCEKASKVMWEGDCDDGVGVDIGIFINYTFTNDPPNTPDQPSGLSEGDICISYDYTTSATDPDGNQLYYKFDWDDGTYSNWIGPYDSGETASESRIWSEPDTYNIKVKAKDTFGEESSWSDTFTVTISNNVPYEPSDPNPENKEIEVNVGADLSWTGGDPDACDAVTYDVYFGTTSSPSYVDTVTVEVYDPGTLDHSTTYYWKIVAQDSNGGLTAGPLWNFTTIENTAPYEPSAPYPTNGSIDVPITVVVNWTGGDPDPDDIVTYDVYFGTNSSPALVENNISDASYAPGTLEYETTYYWQIVAWDNIGQSTEGPLWEFTTRTQNIPPTVNITKPGKAIYINDEERIPFFITIIIKQITIEVEATDADDGVDKVEFYLNNKLVGTDEAPVNGIYSWTWEKRQFLRWRYTIKVVAYDSENSVEKSIKVIRFR